MSITHLPTDALFSGRFKWGPAPWRTDTVMMGPTASNNRGSQTPAPPITSDKNVRETGPSSTLTHDGASKSTIPLTFIGSTSEWRTAVADDGRTYYWNTRTKQVQWTKPSEL